MITRDERWKTLEASLGGCPDAMLLLRSVGRRRFPGALEREFRASYNEQSWPRIRVGMWTGVLIFAVYALWDALSFPPDMARVSLPLRVGLCIPLFAAVLVAGRDPRRRAAIDRWVRPALIAAGGTVVVVVSMARLHEFPRAAEGLILVTLATYSLTGLRARAALPIATGFIVADLVVALLASVRLGPVLSDVAFLATANLIGFADGASLERSARNEFLTVRLLERIADRDGLTGIANRRSFDHHLGRVLLQARRERRAIGLALLDVDHFKLYNDRYGHPAGDAVLRRVASALADSAKRPLDMVARYGGEEFAVVWYDVPRDALPHLGARIHAAVSALALPHEASPTAEHVTVSVGLAWAQGDGASHLERVLEIADAALYEAKREGRNRSAIRDTAQDAPRPEAA